LVFDLSLESIAGGPLPPIVPITPPTPPGYAIFSVRDKIGNEVAKMKCDYGTDWENPDASLICELYDEEMNGGATLYEISMRSIERLEFVYVGPVIPEDTPNKRVAVRVD